MRFDSAVMTQFDKPRVVRPRVGRAVLTIVVAAAVVAGAAWAIGHVPLPMRKAKGERVARTANALLMAMKAGNIEQALQVTAESEGGRKALQEDEAQHTKPAAPSGTPAKTVTSKPDLMPPAEFLAAVRDSLASQGVVWEQIRPLAFGGMQANVQDVRHMKDAAVSVVGDAYFAANDQIYAFEISARCCGDESYITDFWRCSPTGLKTDTPLSALKDRTATRIKAFMEEPIKPGERVGITSPRIVFKSLQEEEK